MTNEETACCCCRLKTAATVFVVLSLIGSVINLVTAIVASNNLAVADINYDYIHAVAIVTCVLSSITFVISCVALYGIKKEKATYLLPWIVGYAILIIYNLITSIVQFTKYQDNADDYGGQGAVVSYLVSAIISFLIVAYIINIVRRYYMQLKHEDSASNMASAGGQYPQQQY